jgi:hypothetical protein
MHRCETLIQIKMERYATNLAMKPSSPNPMCNNECRISESRLVPTAWAICGRKNEHSRPKPTETYEEFVAS